MTKEKIANLTRYVESLKNRLSSPTPSKHAAHPASYRQFLEREIQVATKQLEDSKLQGAGK